MVGAFVGVKSTTEWFSVTWISCVFSFSVNVINEVTFCILTITHQGILKEYAVCISLQ